MNDCPSKTGPETADAGAAPAPEGPPPVPGAITLARHGRPDADRTVRLDWKGYRDWWAMYDTVGLRADSAPPPDLVDAAGRADILLSSTMPRALQTGQAVSGGRDIRADPVFVEAPLPAPPAPGFYLKPPTWGVVSRILWLMGYSADSESRREAEKRAERAAETLVEAAGTGQEVMLFAHGWFNRMLRPALGRRGYRCVLDGGDSYWSYRRFEPGRALVDAARRGR